MFKGKKVVPTRDGGPNSNNVVTENLRLSAFALHPQPSLWALLVRRSDQLSYATRWSSCCFSVLKIETVVSQCVR